MLDKKIKEKVLQKKNLEKALDILRQFKVEELDDEIIKHLQDITPEDKIPIEDFSYMRKNNRPQ